MLTRFNCQILFRDLDFYLSLGDFYIAFRLLELVFRLIVVAALLFAVEYRQELSHCLR